MDKLITRLVSVFFVLAFSSLITGPVTAETQIESWEESSLEAMGANELAGLSGRDSLTNVQSIQELDASVSNSSFNANTMTTGAITIEQHALDNFEGVGLFNIFTGHNNAVNSAVGISIYVAE
tara:strand:+ start:24 stop:392 length:369 start_codon:yes stop_codon:yes gene_type:complete